MNNIVIVIQTKREIFGSVIFPITFPNPTELVRWLLRRDNNVLIEKIISIHNANHFAELRESREIHDDFKRGTPGHPDNDMGM